VQIPEEISIPIFATADFKGVICTNPVSAHYKEHSGLSGAFRVNGWRVEIWNEPSSSDVHGV
jgi:hypothetical protein